MPKVIEKPETTKAQDQVAFCWSCNRPVDKNSSERRHWFKFNFCNTECLDDFKRKLN